MNYTKCLLKLGKQEILLCITFDNISSTESNPLLSAQKLRTPPQLSKFNNMTEIRFN